MDTKEILKKQLSILPEKILSFINDSGWEDDVLEISNKFKINEEKNISLENEVFLVIACLEPEEDFRDNIKNEIGLDRNITEWVVDEISNKIFSKIRNDIRFFLEENLSKSSGVGNSFEQIIRNQTIAMMPARLEGESVADVQNLNIEQGRESMSQGTNSEAPHNLPTGNNNVIHNYITKPDPYREPIN